MRNVILRKEEIKRLEQLEHNLRKYCHAENCVSNVKSCPKHCYCERSLDLDTELAWVAADRIDTMLARVGEFDNSVQNLSSVTSVLYMFLEFDRSSEILLEHHEDLYPELYSLLEKTDEFVSTLWKDYFNEILLHKLQMKE